MATMTQHRGNSSALESPARHPHLPQSPSIRNTTMKTLSTLAATLLASSALLAQAPAADGEVTKIDSAQSKITLRHGEIRNLDMPPMTMVFRVADAKMLDGLSVGDRVRFTADKVSGTYTVTSLVKAPPRAP
jgi:Cu(I)/Ag(I) efflux system periplasmic protein CusF